MISCSLSVAPLLDDGDPVFLLDRDGEAAGTFSRHSPEWWGGGGEERKHSERMIEMIVCLVQDHHLLTASFSDSLCLNNESSSATLINEIRAK